MNFFQRHWTAGDRKIANPELFDPLNEAGKIYIASNLANCAVYGTLSESREMVALDGWRAKALEFKTALKYAGFKVANLGLNPIV
jgi:hypothetical protein